MSSPALFAEIGAFIESQKPTIQMEVRTVLDTISGPLTDKVCDKLLLGLANIFAKNHPYAFHGNPALMANGASANPESPNVEVHHSSTELPKTHVKQDVPDDDDDELDLFVGKFPNESNGQLFDDDHYDHVYLSKVNDTMNNDDESDELANLNMVKQETDESTTERIISNYSGHEEGCECIDCLTALDLMSEGDCEDGCPHCDEHAESDPYDQEDEDEVMASQAQDNLSMANQQLGHHFEPHVCTEECVTTRESEQVTDASSSQPITSNQVYNPPIQWTNGSIANESALNYSLSNFTMQTNEDDNADHQPHCVCYPCLNRKAIGVQNCSRPLKRAKMSPTQSANGRQVDEVQPNVVNSQNMHSNTEPGTLLLVPQKKRFTLLGLNCLLSSCKETFANKSELMFHIKRHDIQPNRCLVKDCGLSFPSNQAISEHLQKAHQRMLRTKKFHCGKCTLSCTSHFTSYDNLRTHDNVWHSFGQFQCTFPGCSETKETQKEILSHYKEEHKAQKATQTKNNQKQTKT